MKTKGRSMGKVPQADPADAELAFLNQVREHIQVAFEPIVSMQTGVPYGFEAVLQGFDALGWQTPAQLHAYAGEQNWLAALDLCLLELTLTKYAQASLASNHLCFLPIADTRLLNLDDQHAGRICNLVKRIGLRPATLCFELAAAAWGYFATHSSNQPNPRLHLTDCGLVMSHFGGTTADLHTLYAHPPSLLKLDPFFLAGIASQAKKKLFVSKIVDLAHVLGITVVAVDLTEEMDLLACKEIGCDLLQGPMVAKPTFETTELRSRYEEVTRISLRDRRSRRSDRNRIETWLEEIPPIQVDVPMSEVFDHFSKFQNRSYFPVLNQDDRPIGVIRERDIKGFVYSSYGKDLLANKAYRKNLREFITPCPNVDLRQTAEHILEVYATNSESPGIIVVDDFVYQGFLSSQALLRLLHEKNLGLARDQNPLTKLPGNNALFDYLVESLEKDVSERFYVYFDFDNFKPFNDTFGFRQGDRVILLFAELLRKHLNRSRWFISHIGGDDFFAGTTTGSENRVADEILELLQAFFDNATSFYDQTSRSQGYIVAEDRHGQIREFPLIACSAAILIVAGVSSADEVETLTGFAAKAKKLAKASANKLYVWRI